MAKVEATAEMSEGLSDRMRTEVEAFVADMAKLDLSGCIGCAIRAGSTFEPIEGEGDDLLSLRWTFDRDKAEAAFRAGPLGELLAEVKQLRQDVGQLFRIIERDRTERAR